MVPIPGHHVLAFHTIWPSYLLAYANISVIKNLHYNFLKIRVGVEGRLEFFRKFIQLGSVRQLQMFQVEYGGGPFFKVVLE